MTTKKLALSISNCQQCPYFLRVGRQATPACGNPIYKTIVDYGRELPSKEVPDPYGGIAREVLVGDIPGWCPLDDDLIATEQIHDPTT
jgi:hypothetical protein